ncbi:galactose-binding domain-like protein [Protomyces lactucae-debilis]|uniref:allantoicase n=1 Tax=Protomyces lactucae-debilis TaxID=2754530 RepID=A0A1Y2FNE0_PROLT|nr:galactose-binding domain-like protein [Protomyces lactucae-debilis]ORY85449.1 galactose-binding domain-like protein [Protomyces lactucae-debilis]
MTAVNRVEEAQMNGNLIDLISAAVGGETLACSDEFFAEASNLINPKPPVFKPDLYVPSGKWFDGWETKRHNQQPTDWVIIKLGVTGYIEACEIDTAFFNGNEAPAISVDGCILKEGQDVDKAKWSEVIAKTPCGPSQRHFFQLAKPASELFTHVRLHQHPDGGVARFRLYGKVKPTFPDDKSVVLDMASVRNGGIALHCSDQHFGRIQNLILPGTGQDMSDGWETSRSRAPGHYDWAILKLGGATELERIVVDTIHFRGNYPQSVEVSATASESDAADALESAKWARIVERSPTKADIEHEYQVSGAGPATHIKVCMHPDGGIKRVRAFGRRI